jgi:hypothetical protein
METTHNPSSGMIYSFNKYLYPILGVGDMPIISTQKSLILQII